VIVLDSSFLIACHNQRDAHHATATLLMGDFLAGRWGQGLLLEYVFLEVMTMLLIRRDLATARRVGRILLGARELAFVPCSDLFLEAMKEFSTQARTRLSFADAAIASTARKRAGGCVLTFDEEFRKVHGLRVFPE
jgi:predicted nucleic acid-binding protein